EQEKRLVHDLFEKNGYNPLIRPVKFVNESLPIKFSLALSQIIAIDEKNQVMKTNVWLQIYWNDYQLRWEPSEYGNIESIRIKPESVWVPDIVLFNNADGKYEVSYKSNCVIYAGGDITWVPPAIYKSSCSIDVQYFPFDQQICDMKFGSWTFRGNALSYSFQHNMDKLDLTDYLKSGTWDIVDCPGHIVTNTSDEFGESKQMIVFQFKLRRKTLFYTVNLIIPCVLISFVSVCVFALPADAGEKITLCISVLLALVVFLLLVSKILPPSLTIPLIAKYLLFTFIMNIVAILATVVIINRNYRTPRTHRMPYWVRVVFLNHLPRYLFMKRPDHDERWQPKPFTPPPSYHTTPESRRVNLNLRSSNDLLELTEIHHPHCKLNTSGSSTGSTSNKTNCRDPTHAHAHAPGVHDPQHVHGHSQTHAYRRTFGKTRGDSADSREPEFRMTPEVHRATEAVQFIFHHLKAEEEYSAVLDDWKYVARVLDRLLLFVFLGVTLSGTVGVLLNAPHILEYVDQDKIIEDLLAYIDKAKNG
ncbi:hypothetical protein BaRGS_00030355, partial [Batillaria attramentaria]